MEIILLIFLLAIMMLLPTLCAVAVIAGLVIVIELYHKNKRDKKRRTMR